MKGGVEESTGRELEEGGEVSRAESEVKNDEFETPPFEKVLDVVVPKEFSSHLKDPSSFSIPCTVSQVRIYRAFYDLSAIVSLMPYFIFQKLHLGELQPTPISL